MLLILAILLMMFHVIFAAYIYFKGSEKAKENFHFLSVIIWMIWLIPFVSGLLMNM